MTLTQEQQLIARIRALPPERVAEIADFVDFIALREDRAGAVRRLQEGLARMDPLNLAPISDDEIMDEVRAARAEHRVPTEA